MRPLTIATDTVPREILTEALVSQVVREVVRLVVPGAEDDASLSTDAIAREDHYRVSVSTRRYSVYEGLESLGATIATKLYERGIPTLIYPEIALLELSAPLIEADSLHDEGVVRIVIPFEPIFRRQQDDSVAREPLDAARESILEDVRAFAPSARLAPDQAGSPKNEAHLDLSLTEYMERAKMLPVHLVGKPQG